jgi:hypothetical protein
VNKPQGQPSHTRTPKNREGKIEIEQDKKDDNHKDVGLKFCTLCLGDDKEQQAMTFYDVIGPFSMLEI